AVGWAYNANVVTGVTDSTFVPGANITLEQRVAMLYRYSGETGAADLSKIKDADAIREYA
ncbi:MAG: S-layer homology domain-containing protein, partial [Kiritimatiellae bacterium]|nr:S-layer homology domain-containing protein [Kiritimatiellia bacterium]